MHVVAGPRQVGKTTLVHQVVAAAELPTQRVSRNRSVARRTRRVQLCVGADKRPTKA
jgi:putative ribosome biogenesis GTPase RsgA